MGVEGEDIARIQLHGLLCAFYVASLSIHESVLGP